MSRYEKAFIYFDTNVLECHHSGKALYLSQFTVNPLYYEVEDLIKNMGIADKVQMCIPEIVWLELQDHMVSYYKSERNSMKQKIDSFRKSFGDLVEIAINYRHCNSETKYIDYTNSIMQDFLNSPRVTASIIPYPKDKDTIQQITMQAIHSSRPFRVAKVNGKDYTDAGFKDALIFNTILHYTENQLGIFISKDKDFSELFSENNRENLRLCNDIREVQMILAKEFEIVSVDMIEFILKNDDYLIRRILTETEFEEDSNYEVSSIRSKNIIEDDLKVDFVMIVSGEKYVFEIIYNVNAKELIEVSYKMLDDSEE